MLEPKPEEGVTEVSPEKSEGSSERAVARVREEWTTLGELDLLLGFLWLLFCMSVVGLCYRFLMCIFIVPVIDFCPFLSCLVVLFL